MRYTDFLFGLYMINKYFKLLKKSNTNRLFYNFQF